MRETKEILRFSRWQKQILQIVKTHDDIVRIRQLDYSTPTQSGQRWPIYILEIGRKRAFKNHAPLIVSGVHGLETIGIRIHLDMLRSVLNPKSRFYSEDLAEGKLGIYSVPILNPAGVVRSTRSNAAGVDLNRNSGISAEKAIPFFGGHKMSAALPYFRGHTHQRETRALFRFLKEEFLRRRKRIHMALDIHSGYGSENFLWWPYSFSKQQVYQDKAFESIATTLRLRHPLYRIEPMALSYQTHGDLWDFALLEFERRQVTKPGKSLFLPFTLEIGTWQEIKKSPSRLLTAEKIFNPPKSNRKTYLKEHRQLIWDFIHLHVKRADQRRLRKVLKA